MFTREYEQRWNGELIQGVPHIKSMPRRTLVEHFMKKSYKRLLPMIIIKCKNCEVKGLGGVVTLASKV